MPHKKNPEPSALRIQPGVEQPQQVSKDAVKQLKHSKISVWGEEELFEGIISGNRVLLSKAITLVESYLHKDQKVAQKLIERCLPQSGKSMRIGITGVPGVGKSTFIEAIGKYLTAKDHKLAVLAIDPSSSRSKGSILGDKTRMEELATDKNAFIRPSPAAGSLGGVARKTWETIILCEAAGFDVIFVETVGVGQSETTVHSMVDFFLLLMLAGAGDELQGIKRGIMEMADVIVINKADRDNIKKAQSAVSEYRNALSLFPPQESGWIPTVAICSSIAKTGIPEIWDIISDYRNHTHQNGHFEQKRHEQAKYRMYQCVEEQLKTDFYHNKKIASLLPSFEKDLSESRISAYVAARQLLDAYFKSRD
jgi:LAO/AO transport system kinase